MSFGNIGALVGKLGTIGRFVPSLQVRGADQSAQWERSIEGLPVALCQSTISTTSEDEQALEVTSDGAVWIVADARLDNRRALIEALGDPELRHVSDETLILKAYRRWGDDCGRRLRGDFAFILWDEHQDRLCAWRDPLGVRTLAYAVDHDRAVIASTIGGVLAGLGRTPLPNQDYLKRFLISRPSRLPGATAFESIHWLPAGNRLEIRGPIPILRRFDEVAPSSVRPERTEEVLSRFRELLAAAVETRMRSRTPVSVSLSGGFDSSSILCLANDAIEAGRTSTPLRSYSAVFSGFKDADERRFVDAVLKTCPRVSPVLMPWDGTRWSLARLDGRDGFPIDDPPQSSRYLGAILARRARDGGCRVLLRGTWADQVLMTGAYSQGKLWDLPLGDAIRESPYFLRHSTPRALAATAARAVIQRARTTLANLGMAAAPLPVSAAAIVAHSQYYTAGAVIPYMSRMDRWNGIEVRWPFLDRDLLEFVMGLPLNCFFRDGVPKRLLRESMADRLPSVFHNRRQPGFLGGVVAAGMNDEREHIVRFMNAPLRIVETGLMTISRVRALVDGIHPRMPAQTLTPTQNMLAVEIWLRHHGL